MNPNSVHNFLVDKDDSSVTRSDQIMRNIFSKAGLKIVKVERQKNFPSNMFPVLTYALALDAIIAYNIGEIYIVCQYNYL